MLKVSIPVENSPFASSIKKGGSYIFYQSDFGIVVEDNVVFLSKFDKMKNTNATAALHLSKVNFILEEE